MSRMFRHSLLVPAARRRSACLLAACALPACLAQPNSPDQRVAWLRENALAVRSIDPPDTNFTDLGPLGDALGDARLVLLGEASHGDGATFLAKGRLIKFLHQRKRFDVLAWEAGLYECTKAGEALASGGPWRDALNKALMWSNIEQIQPTIEYVHATQRQKHPIAVTGMSWYSYADSTLFDEVIAFFNAVDSALPTPQQRAALTWAEKFLENLGTHRLPTKPSNPPQIAHLSAMIDLLARDADAKFQRTHAKRRVGFVQLALENLKGHLMYFHRPPTRGGADDNPIGEQEGRNVLFLARDYFPKRKLIVWAHSGHLMRGSAQIEELQPRFKAHQTIAAGQHIHDALGDDVYTIMFTAYGGRWRDWKDEDSELPKPLKNSLEDLLHRAGFKYAFVDLRRLPPDHWLRSRLVARPIAHAPMRADWSKVYDGIFFIDTMTPTSSIKANP